MKIIIVGAGKVGYSLAENLSKEDNDVTIIDNKYEALNKAEENLDVMCVKGNGISTRILLEAGVDSCDLLIAVTGSDERNMVCCLTGKKLGASHTIARIRNPEYADELSLLKTEMELDMVINPEQATAYEIARLLSFPSATNRESFAKGKVEFVEIKITSDLHKIIGAKLKNISGQITSEVLIGAVKRGEDITIPNGDFELKENDLIYIIGKPHSVFNFCKNIGKKDYKIKNVTIAGGGRIAYYLSKIIYKMHMRVNIIECGEIRCRELEELLPDIHIIHGDVTGEELLECREVKDTDAFVALTGRDEDNLIYALMARQNGVQKVIPKITRLGYSSAVKGMDLDTLVSPKVTTANHMLKYVRGLKNAYGNTIKSLYRIIGDQAEVIEFTVNEHTRFTGTPLEKLNIQKGVLVSTIVRKNDIIIPHGNDVIKPGDNIIIITKNKNYSDLNDIFYDGGLQNELQNGIKKFGDSINM